MKIQWRKSNMIYFLGLHVGTFHELKYFKWSSELKWKTFWYYFMTRCWFQSVSYTSKFIAVEWYEFFIVYFDVASRESFNVVNLFVVSTLSNFNVEKNFHTFECVFICMYQNVPNKLSVCFNWKECFGEITKGLDEISTSDIYIRLRGPDQKWIDYTLQGPNSPLDISKRF